MSSIFAQKIAINRLGKPGKPVAISWLSENKTEKINVDVLKDIFLHQEVKNRKVFVLTVTGPAKTGKSFFLDKCLMYLYSNVSELKLKVASIESNFVISLTQ
jgi:hypothetical protein